jgi:hypothetical protein
VADLILCDISGDQQNKCKPGKRPTFTTNVSEVGAARIVSIQLHGFFSPSQRCENEQVELCVYIAM